MDGKTGECHVRNLKGNGVEEDLSKIENEDIRDTATMGLDTEDNFLKCGNCGKETEAERKGFDPKDLRGKDQVWVL